MIISLSHNETSSAYFAIRVNDPRDDEEITRLGMLGFNEFSPLSSAVFDQFARKSPKERLWACKLRATSLNTCAPNYG